MTDEIKDGLLDEEQLKDLNPKIFDIGELSKSDVTAIKMVARGEATKDMQIRCMNLIISRFSRADDLAFVPNSFSETAFMNGRQYVGKKLRNIILVARATEHEQR